MTSIAFVFFLLTYGFVPLCLAKRFREVWIRLKEFRSTSELTNDEFDRRTELRFKLKVIMFLFLGWMGWAFLMTLEILKMFRVFP